MDAYTTRAILSRRYEQYDDRNTPLTEGEIKSLKGPRKLVSLCKFMNEILVNHPTNSECAFFLLPIEHFKVVNVV